MINMCSDLICDGFPLSTVTQEVLEAEEDVLVLNFSKGHEDWKSTNRV